MIHTTYTDSTKQCLHKKEEKKLFHITLCIGQIGYTMYTSIFDARNQNETLTFSPLSSQFTQNKYC